MSCGLKSGGLMCGGLKSGGLMSGGLKSYDPVTYGSHQRTSLRLGPKVITVTVIPVTHSHHIDRITNASILEQADTPSIEAHIVKSQLSWAGHVRRMPDTRVPKQLLYAELSSGGRRKTGGQWKRYKDQLNANLKKCEMELQWENRADDRASWQRTSRMGVANLEQRRITMEAQKTERRKNRENDNDTADSTSCLCNVCGRICRSAIGLYSHQRTHRA